jgi:hypothetical protein
MTDSSDTANRLESLALNLIFCAVALGLLGAIGWATRTGPADAGWWTRPALMPGVALTILAIANLLTLWRAGRDLRRQPPDAAEWGAARAQIIGWLKPLEYLAYFAVYLWAVHVLGYVIATTVFIQWLLFRVGLRSRRWVLTGFLAALALMLVFRVGLRVWMPSPEFFDLAPEPLRSALFRWF